MPESANTMLSQTGRSNKPTSDLTCILNEGLRSGLNTDFHQGLFLLKTGVLLRKHFRRIVKDDAKNKGIRVHVINEWKNESLRIIDIRIDNITKHPHLSK